MQAELQAQAALAADIPLNITARHHDSADLLANLLLKRGPPGNELEAEPVIDHREATRRKRQALATEPADAFALGSWLIGEACFGR